MEYCKRCSEQPGFHSIRQVGHDNSKYRRPVIYASFIQTVNGGRTDGHIHLPYTLENAVRTMQPNRRGIGQITWLLDYSGFGIGDAVSRGSHKPLMMLLNNYPERLYRIVMINPPKIFGPFIRMLKPFIDDHTYKKMVVFNGTDDELRSTLAGVIEGDNDMVDWALEEVRQNRVRPYQRRRGTIEAQEEKKVDPRGWKSYEEILSPVDVSDGKLMWVDGHLPHRTLQDEEEAGGCFLVFSFPCI